MTKYPYEKLGKLEELLFLDIETTGFVASSSNLYLIGCAYYSEGIFHTIQWFAEGYDEEEAVLYAFTNFAKDYKVLIHYNGNHFDVPYLEAKLSALDMSFDFRIFTGIDLFRRLFPYKAFMKLDSLKQKSIESFLQIERDDKYDGGELISIYNDYVKEHNDSLLNPILAHNYDDLCGLVKIIPALAISDMFNDTIKVNKAGMSSYKDINGNEQKELTIQFVLPTPLPVPVSYGFSDCYFTGEGNIGKLKVSIYEGTLKLFYPNYKDYYYLPEEDEAMHKSVAGFVDSSHRENAKAHNCYKKMSGVYLPEWEPLFEPVFLENYKDKTLYFALTDEFKKNSTNFTRYATHLLQIMAHPQVQAIS